MGLAIVRKLVERQGGKVWLGDGPGGHGLAVHFTWPEMPRPGDEGEARMAPMVNLLLVDDDEVTSRG